jgi:hypothetical protein
LPWPLPVFRCASRRGRSSSRRNRSRTNSCSAAACFMPSLLSLFVPASV